MGGGGGDTVRIQYLDSLAYTDHTKFFPQNVVLLYIKKYTLYCTIMHMYCLNLYNKHNYSIFDFFNRIFYSVCHGEGLDNFGSGVKRND